MAFSSVLDLLCEGRESVKEEGGWGSCSGTHSLNVVLVVVLHLLPQAIAHLRYWPHTILTLHGTKTKGTDIHTILSLYNLQTQVGNKALMKTYPLLTWNCSSSVSSFFFISSMAVKSSSTHRDIAISSRGGRRRRRAVHPQWNWRCDPLLSTHTCTYCIYSLVDTMFTINPSPIAYVYFI